MTCMYTCLLNIISPEYICMLTSSVNSVLLDEQKNWYTLSVGVRVLFLAYKSHSLVKSPVN